MHLMAIPLGTVDACQTVPVSSQGSVCRRTLTRDRKRGTRYPDNYSGVPEEMLAKSTFILFLCKVAKKTLLWSSSFVRWQGGYSSEGVVPSCSRGKVRPTAGACGRSISPSGTRQIGLSCSPFEW